MSQAWWADKRACDVCGRKNQYLKSYEGVSSKCLKKCRRSQGVVMTGRFLLSTARWIRFCQSNTKGSGRNAGKRVAWQMHMLHGAPGCYVQRTSAEKFCYVAVPARMRAVIGARRKALSAMLCLCDSGARGKKSEELWQ